MNPLSRITRTAVSTPKSTPSLKPKIKTKYPKPLDHPMQSSSKRRQWTSQQGPTKTQRLFHEYTGESKKQFEKNLQATATKLPTVQQIRNELEQNHSVIVTGASGSGKTEQIQIALGKEHKMFDLRDSFLQDYFEKNKIPPERKREIGRSYFDPSMKSQELTYLKENKEKIIRMLELNPNKILVFDEFDLAAKGDLIPDELASCRLVIEIAGELKNRGKEIVLILHESGLKSSEVQQDLEQLGILQERASPVFTSFLDHASQESILESCGFTKTEIKRTLALSQGHPCGYLNLIKQMADHAMGVESEKIQVPEFPDILLESYKKMSQSIWSWAKKLNSPETVKLLEDIATGKVSLDDDRCVEQKNILQNTGMIGVVPEGVNAGHLIMPKIAKDVILNSINNQTFESLFAGDFKTISKGQIDEVLNQSPKAVKDAAKVATEGGLGAYVTNIYGDTPAVIPKMPAYVEEMWGHLKDSVNTVLNLDHLSLDTKNNEHYTWMNSATSADELTQNAVTIKDTFLNLTQICCQESGARLYAGPDNKYLLKSAQSISDKVEKYARRGGADKTKVLQKINDSIRATIIAKDIEQLSKAIESFNTEIQKLPGSKFVFSNKWDKDYPLGYVAVHCNFMLEHVTENGTKLNVRGELQFHLEQIKDEKPTSPDAVSHLLYEHARKAENPMQAQFREQAMKLIFTGAMSNISIPKIAEEEL